MSSCVPCGDDIIPSHAESDSTSISATTVQYCSALTSVMRRIFGMPSLTLSSETALNLSTIGRTIPGLQYMMSLTRNMTSSAWRFDCGCTQCSPEDRDAGWGVNKRVNGVTVALLAHARKHA